MFPAQRSHFKQHEQAYHTTLYKLLQLDINRIDGLQRSESINYIDEHNRDECFGYNEHIQSPAFTAVTS